MPIRTRRGRSGAYRALWEWPLHSPARFALVVVVLAVVIGAVTSLGQWASPTPSSGSALAPVPDAPTVSAPIPPSIAVRRTTPTRRVNLTSSYQVSK